MIKAVLSAVVVAAAVLAAPAAQAEPASFYETRIVSPQFDPVVPMPVPAMDGVLTKAYDGSALAPGGCPEPGSVHWFYDPARYRLGEDLHVQRYSPDGFDGTENVSLSLYLPPAPPFEFSGSGDVFGCSAPDTIAFVAPGKATYRFTITVHVGVISWALDRDDLETLYSTDSTRQEVGSSTFELPLEKGVHMITLASWADDSSWTISAEPVAATVARESQQRPSGPVGVDTLFEARFSAQGQASIRLMRSGTTVRLLQRTSVTPGVLGFTYDGTNKGTPDPPGAYVLRVELRDAIGATASTDFDYTLTAPVAEAPWRRAARSAEFTVFRPLVTFDERLRSVRLRDQTVRAEYGASATSDDPWFLIIQCQRNCSLLEGKTVKRVRIHDRPARIQKLCCGRFLPSTYGITWNEHGTTITIAAATYGITELIYLARSMSAIPS